MRKMSFEAGIIADALVCRMHDVQKGESVVITCDSASNLEVVEAIATRIHVLGAKPVVMFTPKFLGRTALLEKSIDHTLFVNALADVDHWIDANSYDFCHSSTQIEVMRRNEKIKYFLLGNQSIEIMYKVFGGYDFDTSEELNKKLTELFAQSKILHITSDKGTDVTFEMDPRNAILSTAVSRLSRGTNTLPANFNTWPKLGSGNGVIVFDRMYEVTPDDIIRNDIYVEIKDSVIIRAWGNTPLEDSVAKKFYEDITAWGCENAIKMAHVSFGLLPGLREYADEIVMDERIWPIMVWGIGNIVPECVPPSGQPSNYHIDGMSLRNSVFLDGEAIMIEDEFIHPQLAPIVKRLFDSMT